MKVTQIQFAPWDKVYNFDGSELNLIKGDKVVVKTEIGIEVGTVIGFAEIEGLDLQKEEKEGVSEQAEECECLNKKGCQHRIIKPILRKAAAIDLKKLISEEDKKSAIDFCKKLIEKFQLQMKLVDVHFSFDGSRATFAFIAEGRIDFRELAKELTRHFNKTIRLQQIGIRDEAKVMGDIGPCGRSLCCARFLNELSSITSEMAELQQCAHRGSERLSGVCGRLKCCLSYEIEGYQELASKLPPMGAKVNVDGQRGIVIGHNVLKQSVDVEFPPEKEGDRPTRVEVDLNRNKKK